jgi:hypothetical protein
MITVSNANGNAFLGGEGGGGGLTVSQVESIITNILLGYGSKTYIAETYLPIINPRALTSFKLQRTLIDNLFTINLLENNDVAFIHGNTTMFTLQALVTDMLIKFAKPIVAPSLTLNSNILDGVFDMLSEDPNTSTKIVTGDVLGSVIHNYIHWTKVPYSNHDYNAEILEAIQNVPIRVPGILLDPPQMSTFESNIYTKNEVDALHPLKYITSGTMHSQLDNFFTSETNSYIIADVQSDTRQVLFQTGITPQASFGSWLVKSLTGTTKTSQLVMTQDELKLRTAIDDNDQCNLTMFANGISLQYNGSPDTSSRLVLNDTGVYVRHTTEAQSLVLTVASVDGTTITYDELTNKISAVGGSGESDGFWVLDSEAGRNGISTTNNVSVPSLILGDRMIDGVFDMSSSEIDGNPETKVVTAETLGSVIHDYIHWTKVPFNDDAEILDSINGGSNPC